MQSQWSAHCGRTSIRVLIGVNWFGTVRSRCLGRNDHHKQCSPRWPYIRRVRIPLRGRDTEDNFNSDGDHGAGLHALKVMKVCTIWQTSLPMILLRSHYAWTLRVLRLNTSFNQTFNNSEVSVWWSFGSRRSMASSVTLLSRFGWKK